MGTVENQLAPRKEEFKITSKAKMKTTFFLILIVALMTADAAPPVFGIPPVAGRPGLKQHGKNKFIAGAGIAGLGLLTGNQGITNLGTNLAGLGLKTKLAAHLFPSHGK